MAQPPSGNRHQGARSCPSEVAVCGTGVRAAQGGIGLRAQLGMAAEPVGMIAGRSQVLPLPDTACTGTQGTKARKEEAFPILWWRFFWADISHGAGLRLDSGHCPPDADNQYPSGFGPAETDKVPGGRSWNQAVTQAVRAGWYNGPARIVLWTDLTARQAGVTLCLW